MFGIGLPEIIILFVVAAIFIFPIVIVVIVLAHVRKLKSSQNKQINIRPSQLPISNENDQIKEALLFFKDSNYKSAINILNRALEINDKSESAFYNRGVFLLKMGRKEKAISDFKTAANLGHKKSKEYLQNLGVSY